MFNYSTFIQHCFNLLFELKEKELKSYEMHNPLSEELAIFIESKAFPIRLNKIKNVDTKSTSFSASLPPSSLFFPISLFTQFLIAPVNGRDIKSQFRQTGGGNRGWRRPTRCRCHCPRMKNRINCGGNRTGDESLGRVSSIERVESEAERIGSDPLFPSIVRFVRSTRA